MNTNKTLQNLLIATVVLIGFIGLRSYMRSNQAAKTSPLAEAITVSSDDITSVDLSSSVASISAEVTNDVWKQGNYYLKSGTMTSLIKALTEVESAKLVAKTNSRHENLGVTEALATRVSLMSGDSSTDILVGAPAGTDYHVRLADSDEVYAVAGIANDITNVSLENWVEDNIIVEDRNTITNVNLADGGVTLSLNQSEGEWSLAGDERKIEADSISTLNRSLSSMAATEVVIDNEDRRSNYPQFSSQTIEVMYQGVEEPVVFSFYQGETDYYVTVSNRAADFIVNNSVVENIFVSEADITFKADVEEDGEEASSESTE